MALTKYCFGDLIELCFIRNSEGLYNEDDTIGVNIDKEIRIMKGDSSRKELKTFWIVKPGFFVYNPRGSRKLGLGYNDTSNTYITTFNNMIFRVKDSAVDLLLPQYLFIKLKAIKPYIALVEKKNEALEYGLESVRGVSIEKKFIDTKADMTNVNLKPYYVVQPNEFAYVTVTSRNGEKISLALNDSAETFICSSSYVVFRSNDENKLLPKYLMLYFSRAEFNRYARFNSWGSARETFSFEDMCDVEIPIPDISVQKAIADIFTAYNTRKQINERLKAQIKDLCPILVKGAVEEAGDI